MRVACVQWVGLNWVWFHWGGTLCSSHPPSRKQWAASPASYPGNPPSLLWPSWQVAKPWLLPWRPGTLPTLSNTGGKWWVPWGLARLHPGEGREAAWGGQQSTKCGETVPWMGMFTAVPSNRCSGNNIGELNLRMGFALLLDPGFVTPGACPAALLVPDVRL